jgi:6-hydroxymethylpterin diphosphokinase MptE-like
MAEEDPSVVRGPHGTTTVWKGINLYPASDPVEYARRKARVFSFLPRTLVFVPSVGLGYGLEELLSRLPPSASVLCVEAHQKLMALALAQGLPRDPRLLVLRTDNEDMVARALREMGESRFRRVVEVPLCAGYRLAPQIYARMRKALEEQIHEYWRNRLTLIALGSLQVRNLISNISLFPCAGDFASVSTSLPVVVAGAGPSLEETIPALRAVRSEVVLVAVDTALARLAAESMPPDVAVALEAQTANLRDFLPPPSPKGTLLACELSSHPTAARLFGSSTRFFSSEFAPLRLFARMAGLRMLPCPFPALGSVGVAAVNAALRMTTGEVFLTGLDFSYPGSLTHARGTPYHLSTLAQADRLSPPDVPSFTAIAARRGTLAEDKTGQMVLTDPILLSYRESLRKLVALFGSRVSDVGTTGLDLGVPRITGRNLVQRVRGARTRGVPLSFGSAPLCSAQTVSAFVKSEEAALLRGAGLVRDALRSGSPSRECLSFIAESDYTWVHFPDIPTEEGPDRSFLARVNAAALHYAERFRRIESLL